MLSDVLCAAILAASDVAGDDRECLLAAPCHWCTRSWVTCSAQRAELALQRAFRSPLAWGWLQARPSLALLVNSCVGSLESYQQHGRRGGLPYLVARLVVEQ